MAGHHTNIKRWMVKSVAVVGVLVAFAISLVTPQAVALATHTAGRTTTAGATMYNGQQNIMSATQVRTGSAAGTLTSFSVYVGSVQAAPLNHMQVALYADTGTNMPGNQIASSGSIALQPQAWNVFAMPSTPVAAFTNYWLVFNADGYTTQVAIASASDGRSTWKYPVTFGSWSASFGSPSTAIRPLQYVMYLSYTNDETPPPPPVGGTPGCGLPTTPGATATRTLTVNGAQRTYLVATPTDLNPNTPTPVIMGFHGGSGTSQQARQSYGLEGSEPVIYVYPQAPYWPEAGGVAWNVSPSGVDFPYFDAMLEDLKNKHCVDTSRVFAAGKSNGGFFVNALACHRPNAVHGLASVAGGGPQNNCPQPKAALIVHGSADTTVPLSTGKYSRDYWLSANHYAGATPVAVNPAPCVSYPSTLHPVIWCQHSGAHTWPTWTGAAVRNFFLGL
jgi:polyhydroxybutyrate depolymerase